MQFFTADYVVSNVEGAFYNSIIVIDDDGKILDLINPQYLKYEIADLRRYNGIICPGFINSHCHTELSYLKNKITKGIGLDHFIKTVEKFKLDDAEEIIPDIIDAEQAMYNCGIVAIGDVCNTDFSFNVKKNSKLKYYTFLEVYGSDSNDYKKIFSNAVNHYIKYNHLINSDGISIVPHAPYSLSQELLEEIHQFHINKFKIFSVHHQESKEELQYFDNGSGNIRKRLDSFGKSHVQPIKTNIRSSQAILPFIPKNTRTLFVHNTHTQEIDIELIFSSLNDTWWCFCPNSNLFIENILPNIPLFIERTNKIVVGTDSLASNEELSILNELICIQDHYPTISTGTLIKWATYNAAELFNFKELASFAVGKKPGLVHIENYNPADDLLNKNCTCKRIL